MKKKLSKKMASSLLKDGRVRASGLYSQKTGRCFDAILVLEDTGQYVNFKLEFENRSRGKK
jgi:DNA topoisomerase-3